MGSIKATIAIYKKPVILLFVGLVASFALHQFISSPITSKAAATQALLEQEQKKLKMTSDRLASIQKTGTAVVNQVYSEAAVLDKQIPQLPNEQVKAGVLSQFNQIVASSGAAGNISFSAEAGPGPIEKGLYLTASFNVKGSSTQVRSFLASLDTISPMTLPQDLTYTDNAGAAAVTGKLIIVGVSDEPLPLDASGNPPAPGTVPTANTAP